MAWIFVDKEGGSDEKMRSHMRRSMRGGYVHHMGGSNYQEGYRQGYKHGWEDHEDDMEDEEFRRSRNSRGQFV